MKKVIMVVYHYSRDPRPRRESEALMNDGYQVDMICLRNAGEKKNEIVHGVNVYRVNLSKSRESKLIYVYLYINFFIRAFFKLTYLHIKNKYDIIHIHNMPDFLVFTAIIPKILGSKVILDMHDPSPEIYETKFGLKENDLLIKFVIWQEKISFRFADRIITTNIAFRERFITRGCPPEKINIIMNSPQESIFLKHFNKAKPDYLAEKFIIMYHGYITERHGLDIAIKAINLIKDRIPNLEFRIFGDGEFVEKILQLVTELKLDRVVKYFGHKPIDKIAEMITEIDLGVIPNRSTPFTDINFPVRIFEYLCLNKPVVVPKTRGILDYFDDKSIFFFQPSNANDLANEIIKIYNDQNSTEVILKKAYKVYKNHSWEIQSKELIKIYKGLFRK